MFEYCCGEIMAFMGIIASSVDSVEVVIENGLFGYPPTINVNFCQVALIFDVPIRRLTGFVNSGQGIHVEFSPAGTE